MSQPIQVCSLRRVPEDLIQAARRFALQERPSNAGANDGEDRLAFPIQGMWKPSRELRIRFLHGTPTLQDKIRVCANEWPRYANIKFTWVDSGDTEIRISVGSGGGSWSNLGTDNGTIPQDQKTMNFGWLKEDSPDHDVNRVVVCGTWWRTMALAENVTAEGFDLSIETWGDSVLYGAAVTWLAHQENRRGLA